MLDSLQSLKLQFPHRSISPAMSSLQGYYGLKPEGTEMAAHNKGRADYLEDEPLALPVSYLPPRHHRRSRSLANGFLKQNGELVEALVADESRESKSKKSKGRYVCRRHKADDDHHTPELPLRDDSSNGFSGRTGKGLAQRPKSGSRAALATDSDWGWFNPVPMGETFLSDVFTGLRKASSTSNLHDSENNSSIRHTTKWNSKLDSLALSTTSIARPIFDGLPKPTAVRRHKAALD